MHEVCAQSQYTENNGNSLQFTVLYRYYSADQFFKGSHCLAVESDVHAFFCVRM